MHAFALLLSSGAYRGYVTPELYGYPQKRRPESSARVQQMAKRRHAESILEGAGFHELVSRMAG